MKRSSLGTEGNINKELKRKNGCLSTFIVMAALISGFILMPKTNGKSSNCAFDMQLKPGISKLSFTGDSSEILITKSVDGYQLGTSETPGNFVRNKLVKTDPFEIYVNKKKVIVTYTDDTGQPRLPFGSKKGCRSMILEKIEGIPEDASFAYIQDGTDQ